MRVPGRGLLQKRLPVTGWARTKSLATRRRESRPRIPGGLEDDALRCGAMGCDETKLVFAFVLDQRMPWLE